MSLSTRIQTFQREQAERLCISLFAILAAVIDQRNATLLIILDHNLVCVYSIGLISVALPVGDERHLLRPAGVLLVAIIRVGGGLFESLKRVLPISGHKTVQHPVIVIDTSLAKALPLAVLEHWQVTYMRTSSLPVTCDT